MPREELEILVKSTSAYHTPLYIRILFSVLKVSCQIKCNQKELNLAFGGSYISRAGIILDSTWTWSSWHRLACPDICLTMEVAGMVGTLWAMGVAIGQVRVRKHSVLEEWALSDLSPSKSCSCLNSSSIFTLGMPHIVIA